MDTRELRKLLDAVASGALSPEEAMERLAQLPYLDLGFAKLDLHREVRSGLPEAVFAQGKRPEDLQSILDALGQTQGRFLVTRLDPGVAAELLARYPEATYHQRARVLTWGRPLEGAEGPVAVVAAGTSDLAVAEEVAACAAWFGHRVETFYDVGVAGLHRLLDHLPALRKARVVVAVAGMDGVLPAVLAGLVAAPVLAVPTSVGYGASFGGLAPLLTMLNACSPGVAVVNIDNGYGAAVLASRILRGG